MILPFTTKPDAGSWSQQEYVYCVKMGYGFAAHGEWWHYYFKPDDDANVGHCESIHVPTWYPTQRTHLIHDFRPGYDWISQCRAAVTKHDKQKEKQQR